MRSTGNGGWDASAMHAVYSISITILHAAGNTSVLPYLSYVVQTYPAMSRLTTQVSNDLYSIL